MSHDQLSVHTAAGASHDYILRLVLTEMGRSRQQGGVTELVFPVCAGVRAADRSLVSGEHRLLSLHAGSVLPGQRGGSEGGSANEKLRDHFETAPRVL